MDIAPLPVTQGGVELVHPVYLDVPMMVNFLASAEGGVSFSSEETTTKRVGKSRSAGGQLSIAGIAGLLGLGVSGALKSDVELTEESRLERQYTAASLFSLLRARLQYDLAAVKVIEDPSDLHTLQAGVLVEVSGRITSDPVLRALTAVTELASLASDIFAIQPLGPLFERWFSGLENAEALATALGWASPAPDAVPHARGTTGKAQQQRPRASAHVRAEELAAQVRGFMQRVRDSAANGAVTDYSLETADARLHCVLTLSTEFLPPEAGLMLDSQMTVIGKVTQILDEDESIDLLRRSVLGYFPADRVQQVLGALDTALRLSLPTVTVRGPGVQILPLAVFV